MKETNIHLTNSLGGQRVSIGDCEWDYETGTFQEGEPKVRDLRSEGNAFYTSSYICPKCGRFMLKANAGEYVIVWTPHGLYALRSVFACDNCKMLYFASPGQKLSQGNYYVMKNRNKFQKVFETINTYAIPINMKAFNYICSHDPNEKLSNICM